MKIYFTDALREKQQRKNKKMGDKWRQRWKGATFHRRKACPENWDKDAEREKTRV